MARTLRAESDLAPLRLVALTGYGQEDDLRRAIDAGFDHHLVKPAEYEDLTAIFDSDFSLVVWEIVTEINHVMKDTVRDVVRFFKTHWPHVLLGIPGAIAITAVHELAHCAAVWVQGGTVTDFVFIPSGAQWGT